MARIRSIKPDLFGSYSMARVPIEARYLFTGMWTEADDDGRLIDSPKKIAGAVFPHDKKVTEQKVDQWLNALAAEHSIIRYESEGGRYIAIPQWEKHQKVSHATPSKLPPPSGLSPEAHQNGTGNVLP